VGGVAKKLLRSPVRGVAEESRKSRGKVAESQKSRGKVAER
jgi:hypothetical protein